LYEAALLFSKRYSALQGMKKHRKN